VETCSSSWTRNLYSNPPTQPQNSFPHHYHEEIGIDLTVTPEICEAAPPDTRSLRQAHPLSASSLPSKRAAPRGQSVRRTPPERPPASRLVFSLTGHASLPPKRRQPPDLIASAESDAKARNVVAISFTRTTIRSSIPRVNPRDDPLVDPARRPARRSARRSRASIRASIRSSIRASIRLSIPEGPPKCCACQQLLAHTLSHSRRARVNNERQSVIVTQNFIANEHKNNSEIRRASSFPQKSEQRETRHYSKRCLILIATNVDSRGRGVYRSTAQQ